MATQQTFDHRRADARNRLLAGLPLTEHRIDLAGVSTAVFEVGDGPPVVLLHGPAGNATHWMRVIPELAATRRVLVPDLPGHGESVVDDAGELDAERAVAWLGELIEHTCASPPSLVGYALGGAIALRFAAAHPDRLGALVLVDSLGLAPFEPAPAFGAAIERFLTQPSEETHDLLWGQCAHDLDRLRAGLGERWQPFAAYNVDCAQDPSALGSPDGPRRDAGGRGRADRHPRHADLGPPRPGHPPGRRAIRRRPIRLAAARDRRLRRRPPDRAAGGVPPRTGPGARRGRGKGARRRRLRGRDRRPLAPALRRAPHGLQRDGRPPAGADRPLRRTRTTWRRPSASPATAACACPCTREATT